MSDNQEQRITEPYGEIDKSAEKRREMIIKEVSRITDLEMLDSVYWFARRTADIEQERKTKKGGRKTDVHMRKMRV